MTATATHRAIAAVWRLERPQQPPHPWPVDGREGLWASTACMVGVTRDNRIRETQARRHGLTGA